MKVIYTKVSNERKKEYALCTKILRNADGLCSMKQALYDEGVEHIKNMLDSKRVLGGKYANSPISLSEIRYNDGAVIIEFAKGELFEKELDYFLHKNDLAGFKSAVDSFFEAYLIDAKECIDAKDSFFPNELIGGFNSFVKELDIDAIFGNIKYKEGEWKLFDYEWTILKYVPTRFFIYRCLFYYTNNANRFSFQKTMYDLYGFDSDEIEACERMEHWFQKYIKGDSGESGVSVPVVDKSYNDMHIDDYYMHTIKRLENECEEKNKEVARLHEQVHLLEIESSKSLKRRIFEQFRITRLVLKIWDLGFKTTINKMGTRLRHEKYNRFAKEPIVIAKPIIKTGKNIYSLEDIDELTSFNKKIAVHLHLFYVDLFEEFIWYLNNMPFEYDLFISMINDEDIKYVKSRCKSLKKCNKYVVRVMENRGRDIAPLYVGFRDELVKYDYFLHMHSKKSLYTGTEKKGWRQMSLDSLLGSEELIKKIFYIFEKKDDIGLVFPEYYHEFCMFHCSWLTNLIIGQQFLDTTPYSNESKIFHYPAGSFFWAKMDAVKYLFDRRFVISDFPEEAGQTDTTFAHVLERAVAVVSMGNGYNSCIVDLDEGVVRRRKSLKLFRDYLKETKENLFEYIRYFEVFSFDVFGTLVALSLYNDTDLFEYMIRRDDANLLDVNFVANRLNAEREAIKEYGNATDIYDIYDIYLKLASQKVEKAAVDKYVEFELACILELSYPRYDVQEMFERCQLAGRKVIITEDSVYKSEMIDRILKKCGYDTSGIEYYISNECMARKDEDTIWNIIYNHYPSGMVHFGDDPRADWQTIVDRNQVAKWIFNPKDQFVMSDEYDEYSVEYRNDYNNRMEMARRIIRDYNSPYALKAHVCEE